MHGGTPQILPQTVDSGGLATRPSSDPIINGHTFLGWFTTANGNVRFNFDAQTFSNRTAHAQWDVNRFTVNFVMQGGIPLEPNRALDSGDTVPRPTPNPTREGHTFLGWFTSADGTEPFSFSAQTTSNRTAFARWEINTFTVNFVMRGGTPQEPEQTVDWLTLATRPSTDPTREGFTFRGWFASPTGESALFDFSAPTISDRTAYARWNTFVQNTRGDELAELLKIHNFRIERMIIGRGNRIDVRVILGERPEE